MGLGFLIVISISISGPAHAPAKKGKRRDYQLHAKLGKHYLHYDKLVLAP